MKLTTREESRRPSASMAGLDAEERARIRKMTSIERMTLALRMGRMLRALAKEKESRGYARVPELVALKLYAGSRFDRDDAARLLTEASAVDLAEVRCTCEAVGLGDAFERLLAHLES